MQDRLLRTLSLGPQTAAQLMAAHGLTQSTLSRTLQRMSADVVVGGRARATRYGARRAIVGVEPPLAVYDVDEQGGVRVVGQLEPVLPRGFLWTPSSLSSSSSSSSSQRWYDDLPWFLDDLRPAGFLGRLVPRRHQEFGLPDDVRVWSGDHVLRFITRFGHDLVGSLIVGDEALHRHRDDVAVIVVDDDYPRLASTMLDTGVPGSSAAGEQPKFLAERLDDGVRRCVLVKWSPPLDTAVGRRWADLLVCEHHAHVALTTIGIAAATTRIVEGGGRRFLESERFDRTPRGRRGVVSLAALDAEHVGSEHRSWSTTTAALLRLGVIAAEDHRRTRVVEAFGRAIANSDMHLGNLSFFVDGAALGLGGLTPIYDMLPMRYAPVAGEVVARAVETVLPTPRDADVADDVIAAAYTFWRAVEADDRVGVDVRRIAQQHLQGLVGARR